MMLLILDKNPYRAAELVPDRLKFKQLLELGQLICSAGISNAYKSVPQGRELQKWIKGHINWTYMYFDRLFDFAFKNINLKNESKGRISQIKFDLLNKFRDYYSNHYYIRRVSPSTAIFRYMKEYKEFTKYETNSELPIETAVEEYKKYIKWKEKRNAGNYKR